MRVQIVGRYLLLAGRTFGECVFCCKPISGERRDRAVEELEPELVKHNASNIDGTCDVYSGSWALRSTYVTYMFRLSSGLWASEKYFRKSAACMVVAAGHTILDVFEVARFQRTINKSTRKRRREGAQCSGTKKKAGVVAMGPLNSNQTCKVST